MFTDFAAWLNVNANFAEFMLSLLKSFSRLKSIYVKITSILGVLLASKNDVIQVLHFETSKLRLSDVKHETVDQLFDFNIKEALIHNAQFTNDLNMYINPEDPNNSWTDIYRTHK